MPGSVTFLFDDNLGNLGKPHPGGANTWGCADVRCSSTYEFRDYSDFRKVSADTIVAETRAELPCAFPENSHFHSRIAVSPNGSVVLVEVSLLDAIADPYFFARIVLHFMGKSSLRPIVLCDVNKTILVADGAGGKTSEQCLIEAVITSTAVDGAEGRKSLYSHLKKDHHKRDWEGIRSWMLTGAVPELQIHHTPSGEAERKSIRSVDDVKAIYDL